MIETVPTRDLLQQDPVGTYNPINSANLSESIPLIDFKTFWYNGVVKFI